MRAARLITLVLPLLLSPGCFVFDEIDKGMEIMEAHTPKDKKKTGEKETAAKAGKDGEEPLTYSKAAQAWWGNAKSLSTAEGAGDASGDPIVKCRESGRSQFMKRSDCLTRGGDPG
jgi:hypothetical protein